MSAPSLFVSPLVRQAARNLHRLEVLTANPLWTDLPCRADFWRAWWVMALTPDEAAAWLPALAFAVSRERKAYVLPALARCPIPDPIPPEARPWRDRLIRNWEQRPVPTEEEKSIRLFALVRLDRRAERLPEWLREARRALDLAPEDRHLRLAALAGWRPRPGDGPPHGDKTGAAEAWVRFWEKSYKSPDMDGLIAAAALLHLAEAGWLPSGLSPERLRAELRQRVRQCPIPLPYYDRPVLQMLLSSVPADASAPERLRQDIMAWLKLTHRNVRWKKREVVWDMLAAWQREGILERCGISLVPDLARTLEWERKGEVLRAMAGYIPGAAEVSAHPKAARAVVARWETHSRDGYWDSCLAAWVGRWNLMRAGVLTAEEQARFGADYVEAIGAEESRDVLLALARITPPGTFPLAIWTRRLSDQVHWRRPAAQMAIHDWLVDLTGGGQLRQMRQVLRRAGQDIGDGTVAPFVNLPPEVWPDFRRLHEIETALAAGHLPPSPDAVAENRSAPRAIPARLPESHPRTGPPGITDRTTGRTAGSEPPARHPFPEVIRHECPLPFRFPTGAPGRPESARPGMAVPK
jgi:hypothetical protein